MGIKRVAATVYSISDPTTGNNPKQAKTALGRKSELQLFEPVTEQDDIVGDFYEKIHANAPLSNGGPISFDIRAADELFTDLVYQSYFKVTAKITKPDGKGIINTTTTNKDIADKTQLSVTIDKVTPVNSFMTALFSKASLYVQGVRVGSDTTMHPFIAYISQLLSYSGDGKQCHLEKQQIWVKEAGSDPTSTDFSKNLSLSVRRDMIQAERPLYGKLAVDLTNQPKLIPNRVSMQIVLERSSNEFLLLEDGGIANHKVEITDCAFLARRVRLNETTLNSIENRLATQAAQYAFTRMDARTFTIPIGTKQWRAPNVFTGFLPTKVVYAVLPQTAFSGSYKENPFVFANHSINFVNFYNDSQSIAAEPLEPDFETNKYMNCYWALLRTMGMQASGQPLDIGWEEYKSQSCLFAQELISDPNSASKTGSFSVETRFKNGTTKTLTGLVIAEFRSCMTLNKHREVSCFDY